MRIIGGLAGGIRLDAPPGRALRPTEDRVKESLFGTLGDLSGKTVVDLFAGTGALGLEALSRGAASVFLIELERAHVRCIERNLEAVRKAMGGTGGECTVLTLDARRAPTALSALAGAVDLILADPPYAEAGGNYRATDIVNDAALAEWAGVGCLLALEHSVHNVLPWYPLNSWNLLRQKTYGISVLSFAKCER